MVSLLLLWLELGLRCCILANSRSGDRFPNGGFIFGFVLPRLASIGLVQIILGASLYLQRYFAGLF